MLETIQDIHSSFVLEFITERNFANPYLIINEALQVPVRSSNASSKDRVEETGERYPVVSIQMLNPKVHKEAYNAYDPPETEAVYDTTTKAVVDRPVPFKVRFQVSFATKSFVQNAAYNTWFYAKFHVKNKSCLYFNRVMVPSNDSLNTEYLIADPIDYSFEEVDSTREDGIYETIHIFEVGPVFVALNDMVELDRITQLNITPKNTSIHE